MLLWPQCRGLDEIRLDQIPRRASTAQRHHMQHYLAWGPTLYTSSWLIRPQFTLKTSTNSMHRRLHPRPQSQDVQVGMRLHHRDLHCPHPHRVNHRIRGISSKALVYNSNILR